MTKYKVYLKGGSVLEVNAEAAVSNEMFVHFFEKAEQGSKVAGSFLVAEIYGFYKSGQIETVETVGPINPVR